MLQSDAAYVGVNRASALLRTRLPQASRVEDRLSTCRIHIAEQPRAIASSTAARFVPGRKLPRKASRSASDVKG
jgi:hypothetical protein